MNARIANWMLFTALAGLFPGCAGLSELTTAEPDPTQFYVLEATAPRETPAQEHGADLAIRIMRVELPARLERNEMLVEREGNRVRYASFDRWAEPLRSATGRVLRDNLAMRLPGAAFAGNGASGEELTLYPLIMRFEPGGADALVLEARWTLRGTGQTTAAQSGRFETAVPIEDGQRERPAAVAAAMSRALGEFADALAPELVQD